MDNIYPLLYVTRTLIDLFVIIVIILLQIKVFYYIP
jgi:hypothetical protein